jgi:hypothetical protein
MGGSGGRESARIWEEGHRTLARELGRGPGLGVCDRLGRLGVGELSSVAVGVLFAMTRRVITIPLRGTEAYLPRQVRLRRWAWWLEWGDFCG